MRIAWELGSLSCCLNIIDTSNQKEISIEVLSTDEKKEMANQIKRGQSKGHIVKIMSEKLGKM